MFNKFKIKIKAFLKNWKAENLIIKDCDKRTPLHCKVTKILSWVCIVLMFFIWLSAFPASAVDLPEHIPDGSPTNLTGYTVTVPAGWTAEADYGTYQILCTLEHISSSSDDYTSREIQGFAIGLNAANDPYSNLVSVCNSPSGTWGTLYPDTPLIFHITTGNDVSNTGLIQWFVDNSATFELTEPEYDTFFIPEGYYGLSDLAGELSPPIENTTVNLEKTYSIPVQLFYSNGLVKQYNHFGYMLTSYTDEDNYSADFVVHLLDTDLPTRVASFVASDGVSSFNFYGGVSHIYIPEDVTIIIDDTMDSDFRYLFTYTFTLDTSFIPDEPNLPDLPPYNMWAYFLEMIIEALKVPIFGYFSIWDIFVTFCGISIVIWFLKLLAGG